MSIDPNGPRCLCGSRGCLETLVSVPRLLSQVLEEDVKAGRGGDGLPTLDQVCERALRGDAVVVGKVREMSEYLPWASDGRFSQRCAVNVSTDGAFRYTRDLVQHLAMLSRGDIVLLDAGSDHLAPRADLPEILSALQAALDEAGGLERVAGSPTSCGQNSSVRLVQGSFEDYVEKVRERINARGVELCVHEGEFRGSRYQNMLYSVLSSRMPLKQLNYDTDNWLTHYAEPLACAAWLLSGQDYPKSLLDLAWKLYLHNQAHDSICGCSTDEVATEMVARYTQAREIAIAVATESLASIAGKVKTLGPGESAVPVLVYNPAPWPTSGTVRVRIPAERLATSCPTARPCSSGAAEDTADGAGWYAVADGAGRVVGAQVLGARGQAAVSDANCGRDRVLAEAFSCAAAPEGESRPGRPPRQVATPCELAGGSSAVFCDKVRRGEPTVSLAFPARDLPAMGYRVYFISSGRGDLRSRGLSEARPQVIVGDDSLENEFLKVTASSCGAVNVLDKRTGQMYPGLNVFEDSGDAGDEYDYSPVEDEPILTAGAAARVVVEEPGPFIGSLRIEMPWEIPVALDPGRKQRSRDRVTLSIVTCVTLAGDTPYVAICTEVDNVARDHRLRVLFPTGAKVDHVFARGQFDVVRRAARPNAASEWFQPPAPVAPHQGFVDASDRARGLAVVTRGLPEYECLKEARGEDTIAVTLLRCIEWLSRDDLTTRKGYAGPPIFCPGAQCPGKHSFEYAVVPHTGSWSEASISRIAWRFSSPPGAYLAHERPSSRSTSSGVPQKGPGRSSLSVVRAAAKRVASSGGLPARRFPM